MALGPTALVSAAEAKAALQIVDAADDATVDTVIMMATDLAENVYCLRPLKQRAFAAVRLAGPPGCSLYPPGGRPAANPQAITGPIDRTKPVTVLVNGAAQTVWRSEADGDPAGFEVEVYATHFYRAAGWSPITGQSRQNVVLSFSGGYDPVPQDLKEATLEVIEKLWAPIRRGVLDLASVAAGGTSVQTLDGQWGGWAGVIPYAISRRSDEIFKAYRQYHLY
jgi:hypothetical protein